MTDGAPRKRSLWKRVVLCTTTILVLLLLAIFAKLAAIAHRPSPIHTTTTAAEIATEDAHLQQRGLPARRFAPAAGPIPSPPTTQPSKSAPRSSGRSGRLDVILPDVDSLKPTQLRELAEAVARL